ncbi:MAG TPA: thiolase family protein [Frankiaceae bacterium]|nr:thiolase family protein [Frankiaceae bacterium]
MAVEDREAYVVNGVRTPFGKHRGGLATVRPDDLAALVVTAALERSGVAPDQVDEVIFGGANQSGEDNRNVARMALLLAGLPDSVPGYTVNRLCASSVQSVASAAQQIRTGEADIVVAGGVESMTRAPYVMAKAGTPWAAAPQVFDTALGWRLVNPRMKEVDGGKATITLGDTAEEVALLDGITREQSDAWGIRSQERAATARDAGYFDPDLIPVETPTGTVKVDEVPRATTAEKMASLKPVFRPDGIVTAGTSSPLADGAGAVVVASGAAVKRLGLTPRARLVGAASAGVAPSLMGLGPVPSTEKLLGRLGWSVGDVDAVEFNEAFAPQVIASIRRLGLDPDTVNTDGGAISLGHPLGATGIRLLLMLLSRLERDDLSRGLATLCVGVGQGMALAVERV